MLETQPAEAQLWVYMCSRRLTGEEGLRLATALKPFLDSWQSHGRKVSGEATIIDNRFLLIGAHIPDAEISGCGIDASTQAVEAASEPLGISWLNSLHLAFRTPSGEIKTVMRPEFRKLLAQGIIQSDTPVFDLAIRTVGSLRAGNFELPFTESWHAEHFVVPQD